MSAAMSYVDDNTGDAIDRLTWPHVRYLRGVAQNAHQQQTNDDINGAIAVGSALLSGGSNTGGITKAADKRQQDDGGDDGG